MSLSHYIKISPQRWNTRADEGSVVGTEFPPVPSQLPFGVGISKETHRDTPGVQARFSSEWSEIFLLVLAAEIAQACSQQIICKPGQMPTGQAQALLCAPEAPGAGSGAVRRVRNAKSGPRQSEAISFLCQDLDWQSDLCMSFLYPKPVSIEKQMDKT